MNRILFSLIGVVAILLAVGCGRPTSAYTQFASHQDLYVASQRHYDLDGVRVGITLLSATDKAVYYALCSELHIPSREQPLVAGEVAFIFCLRDKTDCHEAPPKKNGHVDFRQACMVAASEVEQTVYVIEDIGSASRYQRIIQAIVGRIQQRKGRPATSLM